MENVATVFEEALDEHGLDADVSVTDNSISMNKVIYARIPTRDGPKSFGVSISDRELMDADDKKQFLATHASQMAQEVRSEFTETLNWGENVVHIDSKGTYSAKCRRCGNEVTLADIRNSMTPVMFAESSMPHSSPPDPHSLSEHKQVMMLLGFLRNECDPGCPNSKYDDDMSRFP